LRLEAEAGRQARRQFAGLDRAAVGMGFGQQGFNRFLVGGTGG
jgi:hypothetical protein